LILLCNQHHQLIDSKEMLATYTVERLHAMKEDHEEWVEHTLRGRLNVEPELPAMVVDTVYSNVLSIRQMPKYIYGAPSIAGVESEIKPATSPSRTMMPFIVRGGWLWAFQDLRNDSGPFAEVVTCTEAERFLCQEWWKDPDKLRWYVELLNRGLNKLTGRLSLRLDRDRHRYYFEPESTGKLRTVRYKPLNARVATRSVVWQPMIKATGEVRSYWLHRAVGLRFFLVGDNQWCLSIRPELRVTSDGYKSIDSEHIGRRVTKKKSRLFNYDLLAEVQFWRDFLSKSSSAIVFPFGSSEQNLVVSTSMACGDVRWPGIPAEHTMPFKNIEYVDDLFTWAEAEGLFDDSDLDDDQHEDDDAWADDTDEEELAP
jgi:hypothetical protein